MPNFTSTYLIVCFNMSKLVTFFSRYCGNSYCKLSKQSFRWARLFFSNILCIILFLSSEEWEINWKPNKAFLKSAKAFFYLLISSGLYLSNSNVLLVSKSASLLFKNPIFDNENSDELDEEQENEDDGDVE